MCLPAMRYRFNAWTGTVKHPGSLFEISVYILSEPLLLCLVKCLSFIRDWKISRKMIVIRMYEYSTQKHRFITMKS